jgi:GNAT superfamily N-acetyltransferase
MTVAIRPLAPADRGEWDRLWQGYLTFYEEGLPPEVTETTWARLMTDGADPHGLCAVDPGGRLVGIVHYLFHRSTWSTTHYCYLEDLFVDPAVRGGGIGRALIEAVYAAADRAGAPHVYWLTRHDNATARTLYDRVARLSPFVKYDRPG